MAADSSEAVRPIRLALSDLREAPQLVVTEKVIRMGRADQVMGTPEWPRYPELLRYAADILKWDLSEFDVLRLRVQYPVFGSVIRMQFPV